MLKQIRAGLSVALSFALSFQLAFASLLTYGLPSLSVASAADAANESASPSEQLAKANLLGVAAELDAADGDRLPEKAGDVFHLAQQVSTIVRDGNEISFALNRIDLSIPTITVADFERDVQIAANASGSLEMTYSKKGSVIARHVFADVKPLALARDKELLVLVDQRGQLLSIDLGYARLTAFSGPVPVVPLTASHLSASDLKSVKATYLTRGVKPMVRSQNPAHVFPAVDSPDGIISAGDFALYSESADGSRTMLGQFDRDVIRTQVYTAEAALSIVSFSIAPPVEAPKVISAMSAIINEENAAEAAEKLALGLADSERGALGSLSIQRLIERSKANKAQNPRDKFTRGEWSDYYSLNLERAKQVRGRTQSDKDLRAAAERGDLGSEWQQMAVKAQKSSADEWADPRPLWYRMMSKQNLIKIAAVASGAAVIGVSSQTAWGLHAFSRMYESYWPDVLKDSVYRITLLKSSLALTAFMPLTYVIGMVAATKTGFKPIKALASQTVKVYAALSLPFWHRLTGLTRQTNFMRALALGLSPVRSVKASSPMGQKLGLETNVRPGLTNPLGSKETRRESESKGAAVLTAVSEQKSRVHVLAWTMALQAASHEAGLDPASLALLSGEKSEAYSREPMEKLANDPEFKKPVGAARRRTRI